MIQGIYNCYTMVIQWLYDCITQTKRSLHISGTKSLRGASCATRQSQWDCHANYARNDRMVGFTLIELLVVIAIIAVLAMLILPILDRARENARKVVCISNLKQLMISVHMYINDYNDYLPTMLDNPSTTGSYHKNYSTSVWDIRYYDATLNPSREVGIGRFYPKYIKKTILVKLFFRKL